ncbi:MAG: hypothetical protein Q8M65_01625 [Rhodoglobus sp.]|nr:hypothetical protein [Rhodoglobus sp.]
MITVLVIAAIYLALVFAALAATLRRAWFVVPAGALLLAIIITVVIVPDQMPADGWFVAVVGLGLGALGVVGGSPLVRLILNFAQGGVELGQHGGIVVDDDTKPRREILRGGSTIGHLERLALLGSVAAGQPAAIAIIVAVKGLGRFSELEDSASRERFIIGTLTSLGWAGACAGAALVIL